MGHSRPDTTQQYTDEVELDELADALVRAAEARMSQASPDLTTLDDEFAEMSCKPLGGGGGNRTRVRCLATTSRWEACLASDSGRPAGLLAKVRRAWCPRSNFACPAAERAAHSATRECRPSGGDPHGR
jgi:hypothetical protein